MYFDEQDVVGESCGTQLDVDMMAAPPFAGAPAFPFSIVPRPSFLPALPVAAVVSSSSPSSLTDATTSASATRDEADGDGGEEDADVFTPKRRRQGDCEADRDARADGDSPTLTLMDAKSLAALSIVVPSSQQDGESGSLNANAMQRLHLQTPRKGGDSDTQEGDDDGGDEGFVGETPGTIKNGDSRRNGSSKRARSSSSSPASSTSSSSTCASAVVLARKRALKESWRKRHGSTTVLPRQQHSPPLALRDENEIEDEDQALRIMSFVEYDAAEIDNLVIAPSQDYFGDVYDGEGEADDEDERVLETEDGSVNQHTQLQHQQPCGFVDFQDLAEFNDESSEVFDDVIYAPKPTPEQDQCARSRTPPLNAVVTATSPAAPLKTESPAAKENINTQVENDGNSNSDSEASLSDGFAPPPVTKVNAVTPTTAAAVAPARVEPPPPPQCTAPQWNERRSVKRDCTFIEKPCATPAFEDDIDDDYEDFDASPLASRVGGKCHRARVVPRIEELQPDCSIDSSDNCDEPAMKRDPGISAAATGSASTSTSPAARNPLSFQPRLLKKRRKARQLGLEALFRSRPCT